MIPIEQAAPRSEVRNPAKPVSTSKSIFGGAVGNLVEWYDWFAYSSFSLYFAGSFFPTSDRTAQLLSAAAIFAVGFLVRPAGGWLLGHYADRKGRKAALTLSVLMMCLGSLMIAVAPTYQSIGIVSPILLLLARLMQGLSVGGEYGASAAYLSEMAPRGRRGFYSSFQYSTMILGQLLALGVLIVLQRALLTGAQLEAWGWRIPFAIGAAGAVSALYMRRGIEETGSFKAQKDARHGRSLIAMLSERPRAVLTVAGLTLGGTVAFYTYSTYMQKFLVNSAGWTADRATLLSAGTLFLFMLIQPLAGSLSDRIGRRPLLLAFGLLGAALTVPTLTAIGETRSPFIAFLLVMGALVVISGYTATSAVVKAELFPPEIRALGIGLPHAVTVSLFGGTTEYVALSFKRAGHESWFFTYVAVCIGVSLLVYVVMPETRKTSMIDHEGSPSLGND